MEREQKEEEGESLKRAINIGIALSYKFNEILKLIKSDLFTAYHPYHTCNCLVVQSSMEATHYVNVKGFNKFSLNTNILCELVY